MKKTVKLALVLTVAVAAAQPASAQIIRPGGNGTVIVRDPSGVIVDRRNDDRVYDRDGRPVQPGSNRMRVYRDSQGCLVKEQTKRNGDYRYERKCKGRSAQAREQGGVWRTISNPNDRWWDRYENNTRRADGTWRNDDSDSDRRVTKTKVKKTKVKKNKGRN